MTVPNGAAHRGSVDMIHPQQSERRMTFMTMFRGVGTRCGGTKRALVPEDLLRRACS